MAANSETVYIKADRNKEVTKPDVTLGDVLTMECANPSALSKLKTLKLLKFHHTNNKHENRTTVSILRVIEIIHESFPNMEIQSLGEADFIVTYEEQKTPGQFIHFVKVTAVVVITFLGAAFSIMAFNNDVNTVKLFSQLYEMVTGQTSDGFTILELTYCVGLIIGILTFFNHFGKKKFSVDPTPMEVEMRLYENDIQTTLVETYSRKGKELDVGSTGTSGTHRS